MNDSLTSLLEKNIDLIMEAFNLDDQGNLVEANKKKVAEADEVFHQYFVKRMNHAFRQINENDPILGTAPNMHPMGTDHGMHGMGMPHGMGMGADEEMEPGLGGDEHMGDMAMDDMHAGPMGHARGANMAMGGGMPNGGMAGGGMAGGMGGAMGESDQSGDFDWMFNEDADFEVESLFKLNEEDEEEEAEHGEDDELREFMDDDMMGGGMGGMGGDADFLPAGGMDHDGGANDFGGDMGGMDDGMGGDEDMMTIHGHMDNGGEFEFSFDKDALGFDGGDMGGDDMHHEEHEPSHESDFGGGEEGEDEGSEHQFGESAGEGLPGFHNGKPGKGKRGSKTSRMAVVPENPATDHAAPFPTPQGSRQK